MNQPSREAMAGELRIYADRERKAHGERPALSFSTGSKQASIKRVERACPEQVSSASKG